MSPFGQGSLAAVINEGGSGLGLPIVKGLVDLHEGKFDLKSRTRHGTEVKITFPLEPRDAAGADPGRGGDNLPADRLGADRAEGGDPVVYKTMSL